MKKPTKISEKPAATSKNEQPVASKNVPKKTSTSSNQSTLNKSETISPTLKAAQPKAKVSDTPKATTNKPSSEALAPDVVQAVVTKPMAATLEFTIVERIGLTAGSIWEYLSDNGVTSVAKLIAALAEEEKIIQRSIGWLAKEGKIAIFTVDRIEKIALNK